MTEIAGTDREHDADKMRDRFEMLLDADQRQKPASEQQAYNEGLQDRCDIHDCKPCYLSTKRLAVSVEDVGTHQHEGCCHADEVSEHDRNRKGEPDAKDESRAVIGGCGHASRDRESQELPRYRAS